MKDEQFIAIFGWMKNRLGLKGKELEVYALIYGFSQDGESEFAGSMSYIADTIDVTKPTAIKVVKSLVEKKMITKRSIEMNGVVLNRYKACLNFTGGKEILLGSKESLPGGSKEILPNNNIYNNKDNNNIYIPVLDYLNKVLGTKYKATSDKTRKLIDARVKEGFTQEDFYKVIDNKVKDWKGTDMEKYLRPETLFGTKFESYLNAVVSKPKPKNAFNDFSQREYDYNDLQRRLGV